MSAIKYFLGLRKEFSDKKFDWLVWFVVKKYLFANVKIINLVRQR